MLRLFFELLKVSLNKRERLSRIPSKEEWRGLFALARMQTMEGVLYKGVERLPKEQQPEMALLMQWYGLVQKYERLNVKLNRRVVEVMDFFTARGVECCILKGQGVAASYPDPLLRIPGDIDLWVNLSKPELYQLAHATGKEKWFGENYQHLHFRLFEDVSLEVHTTPTWLSSPFLNRKLQRFFREAWTTDVRQRVALRGIDGDCWVPSAEFNRFFLLLHIYHHLFGEGIGLRQMMDYYYVLMQEADEASLQRTRQQLKDYHLMKFAGATMFVLQQVFGLPEEKLLVPVNVEEGKFLLGEILLAGNFGKFDRRIDRKKYKSTSRRFMLSVRRNMKFLCRYPHEVAWDPFFRSWLYCWRVLRPKKNKFDAKDRARLARK